MLKSSKKGQAITEFLPSCIIFFMIMTGAMSFYRVMRAATIKQEVVRNLTFAKIGNSGTLTTPPDQIIGGSSTDLPRLNMERRDAGGGGVGNPTFVVERGNHKFISSGTRCFAVYPSNAQDVQDLGPLYLAGDLGQMSFSTYAVMVRSPGGNCGP